MKTWMRAAVALGFAAVAASASADIVVRTGVDAGGSVMAPGSMDTRWRISVDDKQTYTDTKVLYPLVNPNDVYSGGQICCGMQTVANTAAWISDPSVSASSPNTQWGVGEDVWIETSFDLTGYDLATVAFSGLWRVADHSLGIYLNGNLIPGTAINSTWGSDHAVSVALGSSSFLQGVNTLEIRASSLNSGWDGLWMDATVTGRQPGGTVPVPATLALAVLGLGLVAAQRRRAG